MMGKGARGKTLPLAIILLILLYLLPSDAVRPSRVMLMTRTEEHRSGAGAELTDQVVGQEMLKEDFIHARIDVEEITKNDYPGSGANNRHDPPNKP